MLEQALAMSMNPDSADQPTPSVPDFGSMSEEEQIAYAMQMSLANSGNFSGYHKKKNPLTCELLILKSTPPPLSYKRKLSSHWHWLV